MHKLSSDDPGSESSGFDAPLEEIAAHAFQNDQEAFTMLYEHYKQPLGKRLLALVSDQETAYDLYQEIFVRIWEYFSRQHPQHISIPHRLALRPWRYFEPWLYKTAGNLAIDHLRHKGKLTFLSLPEDDPREPREYGSIQLSTSGHEEQVCESLFLKEALAKMSVQYRVCLLLQVQWGFTQGDIASLVRISPKAVSTNVCRGYKQLRTIYTKMMEDHKLKEGGR